MPYCRHYAFTVWKKNLLEHNTLQEWFTFATQTTSGVTYLVMQYELAPTTNELHIQGFITGATKKRPTTLGHQFKVQPEVFQKMMKGSNPQKNRAYCTDDSKRKPGTAFFEYGTVPGKEQPKLEAFIDNMKLHGLDPRS